ncbi:MAG: hypothetical protein KQI35_12980, partial [Bacteroidetes bacterium]|nr:hypothetical protein [Bacteroidota bacterium]
MKKLTNMKAKKAKYRYPIIAVLIFTLFLTGCFHFDFVNQPYTADPNSSFSVEISVSIDEGSGIPYFGVLLPVGWTVDDPIQFIKEIYADTGFVYYSDSLSQEMTNIDPPLENYYWWVASDTNYVSEGTYFVNFNIYTDGQNGDFFLDYMLGSEGEGLNYSRSNDHLVIIGEVEGCAPEGVVISCQDDVDNFQTNYPDCSVMAGDITISGNNISNLNGLSVVSAIGGSLRIIDNTALTNLTGLESLATIGGILSISENQSLNDIQGLNNLTSIERDLIIENNLALTQISGLNSLSNIGRDLKIVQDNVLVGLTGMNNLYFIGRNLNVDGNDALTSLSGLEGLTFIGGRLIIGGGFSGGNNALTSLTGLNNLTSIGNGASIGANDVLTTLTGLDNLTSFGGDLHITGNNALTSLTGLNNVTSIGGDLHITGNNALTSLTGLNNVTSIGGDLSID